VPVPGDLERDERAPEVGECPARVHPGGVEGSADHQRQEQVTEEEGQLEGAGRLARCRGREEEELCSGRVRTRNVGVVQRPALGSPKMRERRVRGNDDVGAQSRADEVSVPDVAANVGGRLWNREHHRDAPRQSEGGAREEGATGGVKAARDLVQREEISEGSESEEDEEGNRAVVRSSQTEDQ